MRVLGVRRNARPHRYVDEMFGPDELDRVLPRADFVLVTTPLTRETRNLIGRRELGLMKPHAGLINLSRARVVDYEALAEKLERAFGVSLSLKLRDRSRIRFTAWTEDGVETINDVAEVLEAPDAYFVTRRSGRFPVRVPRSTVVRQLTECERWFEVVDIQRAS